MPDLFRLVKDSPAVHVEEEPFENEAEFEGFVCDNPQLLGDGIKIVDRQVPCGAGRMDILALDEPGKQNRVVIVELKNVPAGINVLLQTLRYANWATSNRDSVLVLLQEKGIRNANIVFDPIRVIVVAPEIEEALLDLSQHIKETFVFDFIELRRFKRNGERFAIITRPGSGDDLTREAESNEDWGWDRYRDRLGWTNEQVELGKVLFNGIEKKIQSKGWSLKDVFVKSYIVFKLGRRSVVGLERRWAKGVAVWFALPQRPEETRISDLKDIAEGSKTFWRLPEKYFYVNVGDPDFNLDLLDDLFETAYGKSADAS